VTPDAVDTRGCGRYGRGRPPGALSWFGSGRPWSPRMCHVEGVVSASRAEIAAAAKCIKAMTPTTAANPSLLSSS
jgi:hypothetical protein